MRDREPILADVIRKKRAHRMSICSKEEKMCMYMKNYCSEGKRELKTEKTRTLSIGKKINILGNEIKKKRKKGKIERDSR